MHSINIGKLRAVSNAKLNYNCSIFEFCDQRYLIARSQNNLLKPSCLTLCQLDNNNKVTSSKTLDIPYLGFSQEDPRVVARGKHVYVFYNTGAHPKLSKATQQDYTIYVAVFDENWRLIENSPLKYEDRCRVEKNWQMFYDCERSQWMSIYSVQPWRVLGFDAKWNATLLDETHYHLPWQWGQIRGGASPFMVLPPTGRMSFNLPDTTFYSWFHSSFVHPVRSLNLQRIYVGGLLSFSSHFPYIPEGISRFPIIEPDYDEKSAVSAHVAFPAGAMLHNDLWTVSFGAGDRLCKIATLSHEEAVCALNFQSIKEDSLVLIRNKKTLTEVPR